MKIMSSGGQTVEVPAEYENVVRQNIDNPEYINALVQSFTTGGSWKPNKNPYKYSERTRINQATQMTYGGMNDHLSVYPMAMNNGGNSNPNFPNQENNYTANRLTSFINMVRGSAQKALEKQMMQNAAMTAMGMPMNMPTGMPMQSGGSTPYQNGLTAGTGWLARHGGSHNLPKAQTGNFSWGYPNPYRIGFGKSSFLSPTVTYETDKEIQPGTQVTGVDVKGRGRSFTLDVNVPQDNLNIANQVQLQPTGNQQDWSTSSFNGPTDQDGNQIQTPDYSDQTPPAMDPAQNSRLAVTPSTPGYYKADKIKVKRKFGFDDFNRYYVPYAMNSFMDRVTGFANKLDTYKKENALRKNTMADNLYEPIAGSRGTWTPNQGYFKPDEFLPESRNIGQYGGSQNDGVYMTEDEIQQILANGGEIEYLD